MYFAEFEKIYYDFQDRTGESTLRILTDITTNVRIRKEVLENITLFDEYDIKEGETPEIIAEKYYGNPELHWIIMLVNQKYDYLNDFPLSTGELYDHTVSLYGVNNISQIHHYEKNGLIVQAQGTLKLSTAVYDVVQPNDIIQNEFIFAKVVNKSIGVLGPVASVLVERGSFRTGELVSISGIRINDATRVKQFVTLDNYTLPSNAFELAPGFTAVTNMQFEERKNESKRRIKLISPQLINQVVSEFRELV